MTVIQPSSRSISVHSDSGVVFHVPYLFFWNGHERQAESIVLSAPARSARAARGAYEVRGTYEVRAFFLFGEVRDRISADAWGITLERTWSVKTPGAVHLSIDMEFDAPKDVRLLFPGVHAARGLPATPLSFLGEKTSYPLSLILSLGKRGALLFSRSALCEGEAAGIGISRTEGDDEPSRLRVQMRFPGIEEPAGRTGPRPQDIQAPEDAAIESPGSLERTHKVFLAFSSSDEILVKGAAAVLARLMPRPGRKAPPKRSIDQGFLAEALHASLSTHLYERGGVVGLREAPGSPWLSSTAGLGCAIAARRLFPSDGRLHELALRLADFTLKGQIPSGFFHESYHVDSGQWRGVHGQAARTHLSVPQSSRIAELLLMFSDDLARDGHPHEKYFLAGLRFVEFFLDEKGRLSMPGTLHLPADRVPVPESGSALGGLELFFPAAAILERTGRDRYRKALDLLVKRFSQLPWDAFQPPCSREGRGSDAAGALLAARLFVRMRARGYKPVEPPVSTAAAAAARAAESVRLFASLLVPWIRVHTETGDQRRAPALPGSLVDSFARQRLIFAGYQTSLLLLELAALTPDASLKTLLKSLVGLCLDAARAAPLGTAFLQHTVWDGEGRIAEARGRRGPVDARRLAGELLAGIAIAEKFPKV
ncbi:MAG: hypothetical protein ABSF77_02460 [Spirochaetia bacterium]